MGGGGGGAVRQFTYTIAVVIDGGFCAVVEVVE